MPRAYAPMQVPMEENTGGRLRLLACNENSVSESESEISVLSFAFLTGIGGPFSWLVMTL
jgi:hypothetical protein